MSYPSVLFVAELEALEIRRWSIRDNKISRSFFQDICEPNSCLYHLCEIPLLPLGWDPFYAPKILFIYEFWPTSLPVNKVAPSYSTSHNLPSTGADPGFRRGRFVFPPLPSSPFPSLFSRPLPSLPAVPSLSLPSLPLPSPPALPSLRSRPP